MSSMTTPNDEIAFANTHRFLVANSAFEESNFDYLLRYSSKTSIKLRIDFSLVYEFQFISSSLLSALSNYYFHLDFGYQKRTESQKREPV